MAILSDQAYTLLNPHKPLIRVLNVLKYIIVVTGAQMVKTYRIHYSMLVYCG